MSLRQRLAAVADDGAAHGTFHTSNYAAAQTDAERARQEEIINALLADLDCGPADMSAFQIRDREMVFVLTPKSRTAAVVRRHGGRVLEETPDGPRVAIPLYFDWGRNRRLVCNAPFLVAAAAALAAGGWLAWHYDAAFWAELAAAYTAIAK